MLQVICQVTYVCTSYKVNVGNHINVFALGPDHISIILSPYKGVHLEKWSILEGNALQGPKWNDRETYFVYYSCASDCIPYTFSIELNVSVVDKILSAIVVHYIQHFSSFI